MSVLSAHNAFSLNLYNVFTSANEGKNFLMSPLSIYATLSMILPGARHDTLDQMLQVMQLPSSVRMRKLQTGLGRMLRAVGGSSSELSMANKAFIQSGYSVQEDYLYALKKYFAADLGDSDFSQDPEAERRRINDWVESTTKGKIADLLSPGSLTSATRLVLANALYFKAKWLIPFDPSMTYAGKFETQANAPPVSVQMMRSKAELPFVYVPEVLTAVLFDFNTTKQEMCMLAVLPYERHGLDAMMSRMSAQAWEELLDSPAADWSAEVSLPKVRLAGRAELSEPAFLPSLGLDSLFGSKADLSGIASDPGDLYVSTFAHQAVLEWDEFGAEGAAATAAVVNTRSMPLQIRFDQPFAVVIARAVKGAGGRVKRVPVFVGRVSDPR